VTLLANFVRNLGEWLADEQSAGACGKRGKPGCRRAAEAVRTRIDWKYALGLD
jgi:hypothetical protein